MRRWGMEMGIGDNGGTRRGCMKGECEMRDCDGSGNVGWSMKCGEVGGGYEGGMWGVGLYWRGMDRGIISWVEWRGWG